MHPPALRRAAAAAVLAAAAPLAPAETPLAGCSQLPGAGQDPLANRAGILAEYKRLPQACLQDIFSTCATQSTQGLLDFGSAAVCSFAYEALLSQRFGGSFRELMAWWRTLEPTSLR
jgi:hypothetical protein